MGKALLKAFYENIDLSGVEIVDVELPLSATLYTDNGESTDLKLIGVIDLVLRNMEAELIAVDHKSAAKPYAQSTVDSNLQFSAYSYLLAANKYVFPTASVNCRMDVLRKLKKPKLEHYHTVRTADDRKRFAKIANAVLGGALDVLTQGLGGALGPAGMTGISPEMTEQMNQMVEQLMMQLLQQAMDQATQGSG